MSPEAEAKFVRQLTDLADQMAWGTREVLLFRLSHRGFVRISVSGPFSGKEIGHADVLLDLANGPTCTPIKSSAGAAP